MRQNKYQSPKGPKAATITATDSLATHDSTSPGRPDHDVDTVSLLSNDDTSMTEEEVRLILEGVAFGEDLSIDGDGHSLDESIASVDERKEVRDAEVNYGYYDDSDAFAEEEIGEVMSGVDTENEYGDEQFERPDSESPVAGKSSSRNKQTRSMSSSPTTIPSGKQPATSQQPSEHADRVRARKQGGGSSTVSAASTTAATYNDGISVMSGGDLTAVFTTTSTSVPGSSSSSSTQELPVAVNESASTSSTVVAGAGMPRSISFTPSSSSSKAAAAASSVSPKKLGSNKSQNHLPPISPSPSKKQPFDKSTKSNRKTSNSKQRTMGHLSSSRNDSGIDLWGFEKTGSDKSHSTRHNSRIENNGIAPIVNWSDGDDGNLSDDFYGFRGDKEDVSRRMSFEEAAGSLEYLARLSQSQGPSRKNSSSHRAELTRMDREIRIYTVDMADGETGGWGGDASAHEKQENNGSMDPFSPTSVLSAGIVPGVSTYAVTPRESECRSFHNARAEIKCWLLMESKTLLIRVYVPDAFPLIDVQAHISLRDLAVNKNMSVDTLLSDFKTLENIAKEIISEVELLVEDESAAAALAAKQRKNHIRNKRQTTGDGMNHMEASSKESESASNKNKPTRRTRLVVHMAHKGRKRHRSTAEAFLDEQFMSHLWAQENDDNRPESTAGKVKPLLSRAPSLRMGGLGSSGKVKPGSYESLGKSANIRRGSFNASLMKALNLQPVLSVPVPEYLEVTRNTMVSVSVTVPGPRILAAARILRPSLNSAPSFMMSSVVLASISAANMAVIDALNLGAATPPSLDTPGTTVVAAISSLGDVPNTERKETPDVQNSTRDTLSRISMTSLLGSSQRTIKGGHPPLAKLLPKKQTVPALVTLSTTKPGSSAAVVDKVSVVISFLASTTDNFNDKKAINIGDEVRFTAGLPSIMQADEEMILEFFDNLVDGLFVVHDSNAGTNTASIVVK